jgi:hypothetical protein
MKILRKAIGGSSILTILGVVCFATILVAATLVSSNALHFTQTISVEPKITMDGTEARTASYTDVAQTYPFTAAVSVHLTSAAKIYVTIHDTSDSTITTDDIVGNSVTVTFDNNEFAVPLTITDGVASGSVTINSGILDDGVVAANPSYDGLVGITYHVPGSYVVDISMDGQH